MLVATPIAILLAVGLSTLRVRGAEEPERLDNADIIQVSADYSQEWRTDGRSAAMLRGRCQVMQGNRTLTAQKMVVWHRFDETDAGRVHRLTVYLEDEVRIDKPEQTLNEPARIVELTSRSGIDNQVRRRVREDAGESDPLYERAVNRRDHGNAGMAGLGGRVMNAGIAQVADNSIEQAQYTPNNGNLNSNGTGSGGSPGFGRTVGPTVQPDPLSKLATPAPGSDLRRVRIFPRSAVPYNVLSYQNTKTTPPEQIWVLTGGVNLIVDGVGQFGTIDLAADRMVIWTQMSEMEEFRQDQVQSRNQPFQVYMEGNIIVRQGQTIARAARAVYDARDDRGLLLNAELKAFIPMVGASVRVRAEQIRQLSQKSFQAKNAWSSAGQYGKPGYRMQSSEIFLDYRYVDPWFGRGRTSIDPLTGERTPQEVPYITSIDNTFFIEDAPVFYSPLISGPADDPNIPIRSATFKQDRNVFGTQFLTTWDMFKLLGIDSPAGFDWDLYADYRSRRGPAVGTGTRYHGNDLFGLQGTYVGDGFVYYNNDGGRDNLGSDRRSLGFPSADRGRISWHHIQTFDNDIKFMGELGYLSDRNYLEEYREWEFDRGKDVETYGYLQQNIDNFAWTAILRPQLNQFENSTRWLPRGDLYLLSEPILGGLLNYSTHTSAAYGQLHRGDLPPLPGDVDTPIPYIVDAQGAVLMSRHEVTAPFNLGPINVVPYAMAEASYWGDDFNGNDISRLMGTAGIRGSMSFWRAFPNVHSDTFNLNGLAHKIRLEADYWGVYTNRSYTDIPQYNEIDEDAQERFRQRYPTNTFNGLVPVQFDPRFYAIRSGAGLTLTAPYNELIANQQAVRLGIHQRLQTKVGPPDRLKIKDWMVLDLEGTYFPDASRDNFGKEFGLLTGRYLWNLGERTSLLANALYDLFDPGQQLWDVGIITQRGERGSLYLGLRQVKGGVLDSEIATLSYSYRMSQKWISTVGAAMDIKEARNIGQSLTITRVGADFLCHFGANVDTSKGNVGFQVMLEPRFGNRVLGNINPQLAPLLSPQ